MTRGEIHQRIKGAGGWFTAPETCRAAFAEAMASRQYDGDALIDAWAWFHFGWNAGHARALYNGQGL